MWGVQKPNPLDQRKPMLADEYPIAKPASLMQGDEASGGDDPMRKRLVEALMNATAPAEGQEVNHPLQALGNAAHEISAAYLKRKMSPEV